MPVRSAVRGILLGWATGESKKCCATSSLKPRTSKARRASLDAMEYPVA